MRLRKKFHEICRMNDTLLCQTSNIAPFLNFRVASMQKLVGKVWHLSFFLWNMSCQKADVGFSFFSCRLALRSHCDGESVELFNHFIVLYSMI